MKKPFPIKKLMLMFGSILTLFIIIVIYKLNERDSDAEYYSRTNLKFNGIIKKVKPLSTYGHNFGVILIDISNSNIDYYDPRDQLNRFLGVIKNNKIDLVFNNISGIKINDSIDFNIQEYKIYRNKKLIQENKAGMPPKDIFRPYNEVKKNIDLQYIIHFQYQSTY